MRPTGNCRPAFDERDTDFFAFSLAASPLTLEDIVDGVWSAQIARGGQAAGSGACERAAGWVRSAGRMAEGGGVVHQARAGRGAIRQAGRRLTAETGTRIAADAQVGEETVGR